MKTIIIIICIVAAIMVPSLFDGPKKHVDYNCSDFKTYAEAKKYFGRNPEDIYKLDKNHDGMPCQSLIGK